MRLVTRLVTPHRGVLFISRSAVPVVDEHGSSLTRGELDALVGEVQRARAAVAAMLDRYPNLYVDTAARVPELGRKAAAVRELILRHPDRARINYLDA